MVMSPDLSAEEQADLDGETLERDTRLDRDLHGKIDPSMLNPVRPLRERRPEEVPIIYRGNRKGQKHAFAIDIVVPDTDNDAKLAEVVDTIELFDPKDWDAVANRPNVHIHLSGPSYHFARGETTLVHQDDAAFLLTHPKLHFERAADAHHAAVAAPVSAGDHAALLERIAALEAHLAQPAAHGAAPLQTRPQAAQPRRRKETTDGA